MLERRLIIVFHHKPDVLSFFILMFQEGSDIYAIYIIPSFYFLCITVINQRNYLDKREFNNEYLLRKISINLE